MCPKDPEFYTPLALNCQTGRDLPALEVHKNQSPILPFLFLLFVGLPSFSNVSFLSLKQAGMKIKRHKEIDYFHPPPTPHSCLCRIATYTLDFLRGASGSLPSKPGRGKAERDRKGSDTRHVRDSSKAMNSLSLCFSEVPKRSLSKAGGTQKDANEHKRAQKQECKRALPPGLGIPKFCGDIVGTDPLPRKADKLLERVPAGRPSYGSLATLKSPK